MALRNNTYKALRTLLQSAQFIDLALLQGYLVSRCEICDSTGQVEHFILWDRSTCTHCHGLGHLIIESPQKIKIA